MSMNKNAKRAVLASCAIASSMALVRSQGTSRTRAVARLRLNTRDTCLSCVSRICLVVRSVWRHDPATTTPASSGPPQRSGSSAPSLPPSLACESPARHSRVIHASFTRHSHVTLASTRSPAEEERLLLAIQKPSVTGSGRYLTSAGAYEGNYATVQFNSGPNLGGNYTISCYPVASPTADPASCSDLVGVQAEATVASQALPKLYSSVANNVTGLYSEAVDCYVTADGITGKVDKCQYAGRATNFDAYIAYNGVTVKCPGIDIAAANPDAPEFALNGTDYTKVTRADILLYDGAAVSLAAFEDLLEGSCTTGITDMSSLLDVANAFNFGATQNANIGSWDVSSVTTFASMFGDAALFNNGDSASIGSWNVSSAEDLSGMFIGAFDFNQPIGTWNTSAVTDMRAMWVLTSTDVLSRALKLSLLLRCCSLSRLPGSLRPPPSTSPSAPGTRAR